MTQERFKRCPSCENFIPEQAAVCQYCGAGQQAFKPEKKKGGLGRILFTVVLVFFGCGALAVVGALFLDDESPATSSPSGGAEFVVRPTFTPTMSAEQEALALVTMVPTVEVPTPIPTPAPVVGQDVMVSDIRWKVLEALDVGQELVSDNQFIDTKRTTGRFIKVRFEIENRKADQESLGGVPLRDAQGREYERYSDAYMFVPDGESCIFENLNPNITRYCTVFYEVAADATNLVFVATDLNVFMGGESLISLGF